MGGQVFLRDNQRVEVLIPWRVTSTITSLSPFTPISFSKATFSKRHFSSFVGHIDLCLTETGFSLLGAASANAKSLLIPESCFMLNLSVVILWLVGCKVDRIFLTSLAAFFSLQSVNSRIYIHVCITNTAACFLSTISSPSHSFLSSSIANECAELVRGLHLVMK